MYRLQIKVQIYKINTQKLEKNISDECKNYIECVCFKFFFPFLFNKMTKKNLNKK